MSSLADDILAYVEQRDHVSFAELSREIPGFKASDPDKRMGVFHSDHDMCLYWSGLSQEAAEALAGLIRDKRLHYAHTSTLIYAIDGMMLKLPIFKARHVKRPPKSPHWLPVVLRPGPFEARTRKTLRPASKSDSARHPRPSGRS